MKYMVKYLSHAKEIEADSPEEAGMLFRQYIAGWVILPSHSQLSIKPLEDEFIILYRWEATLSSGTYVINTAASEVQEAINRATKRIYIDLGDTATAKELIEYVKQNAPVIALHGYIEMPHDSD